MNSTQMSLRDEVHKLAEEAFQLKLISGYGDGQYSDEYQIVHNGKPMHFPLDHARTVLKNLITTSRFTCSRLE